MVTINPNSGAIQGTGGTVPETGSSLEGLLGTESETFLKSLGLAPGDEVPGMSGVTADTLLTAAQTTLEAASAQTATPSNVYDPTIMAPDLELLQSFIDKMGSMPTSSSGQPSIPVAGNAWMNVTAFVTVCLMIYEITSVISKIKVTEARLQILMQKINAEMAKDIASGIERAGSLQAQMRMNAAYQALVEAGTAITSMVMTGLTTAIRQVKIAEKCGEWSRSQQPPGQVPNPTVRLQISQEVDGEMKLLENFSQSLPQVIKSLTTASVEARNAALEILKAQAEATKTELEKLADIMRGTIDTLRGDQSDLSQTISKLLENFLSSFSRQRLSQNN